MGETIAFDNMIGAANGDKQNMLGKLLYFSLSNILIEKNELRELCDSMGIYYAGGNRISVSDAFRSATGDIRERVVSQHLGERQICQIYCRDNQRTTSGIISRELVKETLNRETNQYEKLANISFDKDSNIFNYDNLVYDSEVDAMKYCRQAEELFELYKRCANRRQIETICIGYIRSLEATKLNVNGHLYFVPRHTMEKVSIFEDFIDALNSLNRTENMLMANSIYIIDDAKQREKMTNEFYSSVKKEIAEYQERADYLIKSGSNSPAIMERWVTKIQALEDKKIRYEEILKRELDGLDEEFETLKFLARELAVRSQRIRNQRCVA